MANIRVTNEEWLDQADMLLARLYRDTNAKERQQLFVLFLEEDLAQLCRHIHNVASRLGYGKAIAEGVIVLARVVQNNCCPTNEFELGQAYELSINLAEGRDWDRFGRVYGFPAWLA